MRIFAWSPLSAVLTFGFNPLSCAIQLPPNHITSHRFFPTLPVCIVPADLRPVTSQTVTSMFNEAEPRGICRDNFTLTLRCLPHSPSRVINSRYLSFLYSDRLISPCRHLFFYPYTVFIPSTPVVASSTFLLCVQSTFSLSISIRRYHISYAFYVSLVVGYQKNADLDQLAIASYTRTGKSF